MSRDSREVSADALEVAAAARTEGCVANKRGAALIKLRRDDVILSEEIRQAGPHTHRESASGHTGTLYLTSFKWRIAIDMSV
jgi:hypothetical protein